MLTIDNLKEIMIPTLRKNDVVKAGIFGSYATGEQCDESDIDVIIQFKGEKSLLDLIGLKLELEESTGKKVDVLTYESLYSKLRDIILDQEISLL